MAEYAITYQLDIYNRSGTAVVLSLTSIAGGTNPYLSSIPHGDGQEINPLTGERRAGAYVGLIVDAITSGTDRIVTSNLEDAGFRQQLMRRKAILSMTVDGTDTKVLCAGKLTSLRLVNTIEYEYTVTDDTVISANQKLFAPKVATITLSAGALAGATSLSCDALAIGLAKNTPLYFGGGKTAVTTAYAAAGATSVSVAAIPVALLNDDFATYRESVKDFIARWPKRGCAFGGPVKGNFMDLREGRGWVMRWMFSAANTYQLRFLTGYGPPDFNVTISELSNSSTSLIESRPRVISLGNAINERVGPGQVRLGTDGQGVNYANIRQSPVTTFDQAAVSPFANDLILEILSGGAFGVGGTSYGYVIPIPNDLAPGDQAHNLVDIGQPTGSSAGTEPGIHTGLNTTGLLTDLGVALGQSVRVRAFTARPSELSPIYLEMHPVEVAQTLLEELGYTVDATSVTDLKAVLGNDLIYRTQITGQQDARWLTDEILGPFAIGVRMADDGDLEVFSLRIFDNAAPGVEITADDVVSPDEEGGEVFAISESTAIAQVNVEMNAITSSRSGDPDVPADGVLVKPILIERKNGDPGVVGDRIHTWSLSGMIGRTNGTYKPETAYWDSPIKEVFDRFGRGVIECELPLLYGGSATDLKIGEEAIITLPQLPNKNKRYGDDNTVGGRAMQLVRLTRMPWGAVGKFIDSGPNAQPYATAPTLSIAASSSYANTVADLTITNAATLNAAGAGVRVRMAIVAAGGSAPAAGDYADVVSFPAGQIPTSAFALPPVQAGYKVYAKARTEIASDRPSNYSSASSVTLTAYTAPSGVTVSAGSDGSQVTASWTVGESTLRAEVYVRKTSGTTATDDRLLDSYRPGTNTAVITGLEPGTGYTVSVAHRNAETGFVTAKATGTVTTAAAPAALEAPTGERGWVGSQDASFAIPTEPSSYGIAVRSNYTGMDLEAYEAVETAVGSGSYSDFVFLTRAGARQGTWSPLGGRAPNDGLRRRIKARHVRQGMHRGAAAMSVAEMAALTVAEAATLYAGSHASESGEYVTVTPYTNTPIQKTRKTMKYMGSQFTPEEPGVTSWAIGPSGAAYRTALAGTSIGYVTLELPLGTTFKELRLRAKVTGLPSEVTAALYSGVDDAVSLVTSAVVDYTTTGFATESTGPQTLAIEAGTNYLLALIIDNTAAAVSTDTQGLWVEIDYDSPALDVSR